MLIFVILTFFGLKSTCIIFLSFSKFLISYAVKHKKQLVLSCYNRTTYFKFFRHNESFKNIVCLKGNENHSNFNSLQGFLTRTSTKYT